MNLIDACMFTLLAIADIALLAYLRRRHRKSARAEHMMRCLEFALRREAAPQRKVLSVNGLRPC
jgi:hypothetical protein